MLTKKIPFIYISLIIAMLSGRLIWGGAMLICLTAGGSGFGLSAFVAGAFTNAIPGIILQILLIPAAVMLLRRYNLLGLKESKK